MNRVTKVAIARRIAGKMRYGRENVWMGGRFQLEGEPSIDGGIVLVVWWFWGGDVEVVKSRIATSEIG
jgi:hypothetical protein